MDIRFFKKKPRLDLAEKSFFDLNLFKSLQLYKFTRITGMSL